MSDIDQDRIDENAYQDDQAEIKTLLGYGWELCPNHDDCRGLINPDDHKSCDPCGKSFCNDCAAEEFHICPICGETICPDCWDESRGCCVRAGCQKTSAAKHWTKKTDAKLNTVLRDGGVLDKAMKAAEM